MSHQASIPKYIDEGLDKQDPATLRAIARKAERLADEKQSEAEEELEENAIDDEEVPDDIDRDDAPQKACVTVKSINGNDYYYYQWREGKKIKSEYIRPVSPDT